MRYLMMTMIAVLAAGCATQALTPETAARRHAANMAAAAEAGYQVIARNDQTVFCPTRAPIGSHLTTCLTEREWEQEQASVFRWRVFASPEPFTVDTRESF